MRAVRSHETLTLTLPDGGALHGRWSGGDVTSFAVLYVHGFGSVHWGEKSQALEAECARRGWSFAACDFRGHGRSSGRLVDLRCSRLLEDLDLIRAFLQARGVRTIIPVGSSMGGWASAWWAMRNGPDIPACVLIAPAFQLPTTIWDRLTPEQHAEAKRAGRLRVRNQWLDVELDYALFEDARPYHVDRLVARWTKPALIFHGMRDDVVPYQHTLDFVQRVRDCPVELRLFKQGDHRLSAHKDEIAEAACRFVERFV